MNQTHKPISVLVADDDSDDRDIRRKRVHATTCENEHPSDCQADARQPAAEHRYRADFPWQSNA